MAVPSVFLSQWLFAAMTCTALTTLGAIPRFIRESPFQRLLLLLLVLCAGEVTHWLFHHPWLILAVLLPPLVVSLIDEGSAWASWASINGICLLQAIVVFLIFSAYATSQGGDLFNLIVGGAVWMAQAISVMVTLFATFDLLNTLGRRSRSGKDRLLEAPDPQKWPGVCIQVPAHDEPPNVLARTITQLMRQDYPARWMVQVIDNNTPDPRTWLPIQALCEQLGKRVQFIHLEHWTGYKAGALNEGTRHLPDWVEVVAVIDADYLVKPDFLRATARHFADPQVGFVQSLQHYRAWHGSAYFEGLNFMYEYFFAVNMASRQELNSIVCFGSMCLIRRSALEMIAGWDEESITEDVELSVRLLAQGWRGLYDHRIYGTGLMPLNFGSLKKQRFRWAYGTIQIIKKHWRLMLGLPSNGVQRLSLKQRLCFWGLAMQYIAEVLPFAFALLLTVTVLASSLGWHTRSPALTAATIGPLLLFGVSCVRTMWALREVSHCTRSQALGALIFFLALSWITARACISACVRSKAPFLRTPKMQGVRRWQQAVHMTFQEIVLFLLLVCMALLAAMQHHAQLLPAAALLGLQAGIYGQAVLCALAAEGICLLPRRLLGSGQGKEHWRAEKNGGIVTGLDGRHSSPPVTACFARLQKASGEKRSPAWQRDAGKRKRTYSPKRVYYF